MGIPTSHTHQRPQASATDIQAIMSSEETKPVAAAAASAATESAPDMELEKEMKVTEGEIAQEASAAEEAKSGEAEAEVKKEEEVSDGDKEEKIVQEAVKQITFYLSDSNLPYDKFLFTQAQKSLKDPKDPMGTG